MNPYADCVFDYWRAGWKAPLPIPLGAKGSPPRGFTGWGGMDPTYEQIQDWVQNGQPSSIAIRVPDGVVGFDVDAHGDKAGGATLTRLEHEYGRLPDTWVVTNRHDGVSGTYFFRTPPLPPGMTLIGGWEGIDLIHKGLRYQLVPPSLHPEGRAYRWVAHGVDVDTTVPTIDRLAELPEAWWLSILKVGQPRPRAGVGSAAVLKWLEELRP